MLWPRYVKYQVVGANATRLKADHVGTENCDSMRFYSKKSGTYYYRCWKELPNADKKACNFLSLDHDSSDDKNYDIIYEVIL